MQQIDEARMNGEQRRTLRYTKSQLCARTHTRNCSTHRISIFVHTAQAGRAALTRARPGLEVAQWYLDLVDTSFSLPSSLYHNAYFRKVESASTTTRPCCGTSIWSIPFHPRRYRHLSATKLPWHNPEPRGPTSLLLSPAFLPAVPPSNRIFPSSLFTTRPPADQLRHWRTRTEDYIPWIPKGGQPPCTCSTF